MIRRPPTSTLFPTASLSRSHTLHRPAVNAQSRIWPRTHRTPEVDYPTADGEKHLRESEGQERVPRSEEHTSELQSRQYLVCRLLLEKKKSKSYHRHLYNYAD